jgi:hypothetical protein
MKALLLFIAVLVIWFEAQIALDATHPCSAFNPASHCTATL